MSSPSWFLVCQSSLSRSLSLFSFFVCSWNPHLANEDGGVERLFHQHCFFSSVLAFLQSAPHCLFHSSPCWSFVQSAPQCLSVPSQAITAVAAKNGVFGPATEEIESVPFCFSLLFVIYLCFLFNLPSVISLFFLPDCVLCVCPSAQGGGATGDEAGVRMLAGQCSSPLLSRFLLQFFPGFFLLFFSSLSVPFPQFFFLFPPSVLSFFLLCIFFSLIPPPLCFFVSVFGFFPFSLPCDLSFSGFYSQRTIRFFQPLIAGVMAAMAAAGVRWRRWTAYPQTVPFWSLTIICVLALEVLKVL